MVKIPFNKTVRFVLSSSWSSTLGPFTQSDTPFMLRKLDIYPDYESDTEFISDRPKLGCDVHVNAHNMDIECSDVCEYAIVQRIKNLKTGCHPYRCTKPGWKNGGKPTNDLYLNSHTIRKDTVMVSAGGYVVIITLYPGHWFMHCHIDTSNWRIRCAGFTTRSAI